MLRSRRRRPLPWLLLEHGEPANPLDPPQTSTHCRKMLSWPIWKPDPPLGKTRWGLRGSPASGGWLRMTGQVLLQRELN